MPRLPPTIFWLTVPHVRRTLVWRCCEVSFCSGSTMNISAKAIFIVLFVSEAFFVLWAVRTTSFWTWTTALQDPTYSQVRVLEGRGTVAKQTPGSTVNTCYPGLFETVSACGKDQKKAKHRNRPRPVQHLYFLKVGSVATYICLTEPIGLPMDHGATATAPQRTPFFFTVFLTVPHVVRAVSVFSSIGHLLVLFGRSTLLA